MRFNRNFFFLILRGVPAYISKKMCLSKKQTRSHIMVKMYSTFVKVDKLVWKSQPSRVQLILSSGISPWDSWAGTELILWQSTAHCSPTEGLDLKPPLQMRAPQGRIYQLIYQGNHGHLSEKSFVTIQLCPEHTRFH